VFRSALVAISLAAASLAACSPDASAPKPVRSVGTADVGGPFHLVDQNGTPQTEQLLKGKWSAVFFGFTYCPDVCPTTLQALEAAKRRLGPAGRDLQVVLMTVDPERDTPAALKSYLATAAFPAGTVGLTGEPAKVQEALKAYRVYARKTGEGDDYLVDHSTVVYLMDPQGELARVLAYGQTPEQMAEQIRQAMADRV
jgi:protein SCO1/2